MAKKRKRSGRYSPSGLHAPVTRQAPKPVFAQPSPTEDPTTFHIPHASDGVGLRPAGCDACVARAGPQGHAPVRL